ncbi:hypothetical protein COW46_01220 [Candidatus Gracilibacteria bacterium CG17_big_fil_post_rev_8_21_14_2_50_48_13]|nr:MAG: hypothetical protein COW46_01220 [Candidatus Gracilibacteria bacterium CG17_big_fil_post_rev_8_21_14_2_50_48_13]
MNAFHDEYEAMLRKTNSPLADLLHESKDEESSASQQDSMPTLEGQIEELKNLLKDSGRFDKDAVFTALKSFPNLRQARTTVIQILEDVQRGDAPTRVQIEHAISTISSVQKEITATGHVEHGPTAQSLVNYFHALLFMQLDMLPATEGAPIVSRKDVSSDLFA